MPNKNYVKGRNFEYRIISYLRKKGYYCLRAYGSKGLVDILAIRPNYNPDMEHHPLMIQAKYNGYVHPDEMKKLKENEHKWQGWIIIAYSENHKLKFRTLDGHIISHL